jgi:hypothetical protein
VRPAVRAALAGPEVRNRLDVTFDVSAEDEHLEAVGVGLELTRDPGTDPHGVQFD